MVRLTVRTILRSSAASLVVELSSLTASSSAIAALRGAETMDRVCPSAVSESKLKLYTSPAPAVLDAYTAWVSVSGLGVGSVDLGTITPVMAVPTISTNAAAIGSAARRSQLRPGPFFISFVSSRFTASRHEVLKASGTSV